MVAWGFGKGVTMWAGVGVLLGLMVLASVLGFHVGPHSHLAAFGLGVAAAVLLVVLAATGQNAPLAWVLFGADVAISSGLGVIAWRGLKLNDGALPGSRTMAVVGAEGVAVTDLHPDGIVRVRGENWSATCLNGSVGAGHLVQVVETSGVRLGVWSDEEEGSTLGAEADGLPRGLEDGAGERQEGAQ
jgi:membrane-bound ClpP family serine protease